VRGCSRCGGEGSRRAASTVLRRGGESTFYTAGGQAGRSRGGSPSGGWWCFIKALVMKEDARGGHLMRGNEGGETSVWFVSIRVRESGTRRRMVRRRGPKVQRRLGCPKVGEDPQLGQHRKIPRKMKMGYRRCLGRNANWASEWISKLISRILCSNQKR
jgi:hypothetical protein